MAKINIKKTDPNSSLTTDYTSKKVDEMKSDISSICQTLSSPSNRFNVKEAFNEIKKYVSNYDRLLYAEISTFCYNLQSEETDNFQGNLNSLIEYVYSKDYDNGLKAEKGNGNDDEVSLRERTKRIVIKLYDNVNLACAQLSSLKQSEEELHQHFIKEFAPAKAEITKDINAQLITLVGIFTAIAFLVFGGFSSLTDLFSHIEDDLPKTIMLISIWGIIICDGLFVFLSCVNRIIQKDRFFLFRRNSVFCWSNYILLLVFTLSLWTHIVDKYDWGGAILYFCEMHISCVAIVGFLIIVFAFIFVALLLAIKRKKQ